ncbi:MAG: prephenate dehydrogenase/arogenate dehydrogenase family protein [Anaerosomatales bacterium]|nr:prephenate dehydrogenase/arogenate dehydrogenase family protein [Anaerosomatales bacterium]
MAETRPQQAPFSRVTVVGLGLIGGSVAHAARRAGVVRVRGVDTDARTVALAVERGACDEALTVPEAWAAGWFAPDPDGLVVLATPVDATLAWIAELAQKGFRGVVTDVASTKAAVMAAAAGNAREGLHVIGGHPMAGSERSGIDAASPTLLDGAYHVLTPAAHTDADAFRRLHAFVTSLGARVISVPAAAHDEAVAVISHVPHVAAAALIALAGERARSGGQDLLRLAAGGFKDMTRIAAGSPGLWTGICLDNAEAVIAGVEDLRRVLGDFSAVLGRRDAEALEAWLAEAAEQRRALPAQWVPATSALSELSILMRDEPGVISTITTAVGRHGCNIEDIEIDHQSEDAAVLRLVLTDEGDIGGLMAELAEAGFAPQLKPLE